MILTFRPIKVWPETFKPAGASRPSSQFSASYKDTLSLLQREIEHLGGRDVILQVDASEGDCRIDGQLRANAKVGHPGVILSFTTRKHGALSYPCDSFDRSWAGREQAAWKHNLRAIALGLEALRKVERYGIAERGQQYAGFREIGTGIALGPAAMTEEQAARILVDAEDRGGDWTDLLHDSPETEAAIKATFANAAKVHHPDVGGDPDVFRTITTARDRLLA